MHGDWMSKFWALVKLPLKFASVAFGAYFVPLVAAALVLYRTYFSEGKQAEEGMATVWKNTAEPLVIFALCGLVFLILLVIFFITCIRNEHRKKLLKIYYATQFDYKCYASLKKPEVVQALESWFKELPNKGKLRYLAVDKEHSAMTFFNGGSDVQSYFRCLPVREGEKRDRCIIQLSYIPEDKQGRIPLIARMKDYHPTEVIRELEASLDSGFWHKRKKKTNGKRKGEVPKLSFISFSPIPEQYHQTFSLEGGYYREVPRPTEEQYKPTFQECCIVMRRDEQNRLYIFFVVRVKYPNVEFLTPEGDLNTGVLHALFGDPSSEQTGEPRYFLKDHDEILYAANPMDILDYSAGEDCDLAKRFKERVETIRGTTFDLSKAKLMGVEETILRQLVEEVGK